MKTYARIQDGRVAELFATDGVMSDMFYPSLQWVETPRNLNVAAGWEYDGGAFCTPRTEPRNPPPPSLADVQAQMNALASQIALLAQSNH